MGHGFNTDSNPCFVHVLSVATSSDFEFASDFGFRISDFDYGIIPLHQYACTVTSSPIKIASARLCQKTNRRMAPS